MDIAPRRRTRSSFDRAELAIILQFVLEMRVPVRHLSSSGLLECRPNDLARRHVGGDSKYSVAIKRPFYYYLLVELQNYDV